MKPKKLIVSIRVENGYMTAYLTLGGAEHELCRAVSPPRHAVMRTQIMEAFQKLASTLLESIVREEHPDADFSTAIIHTPPAGRG